MLQLLELVLKNIIAWSETLDKRLLILTFIEFIYLNFLSCHNAVFMLCLDLGTKPPWLGSETRHGLA